MASNVTAVTFYPNKRKVFRLPNIPNSCKALPHSKLKTVSTPFLKKQRFCLLHIPSAASPFQLYPTVLASEISNVEERDAKENKRDGALLFRILLLWRTSIFTSLLAVVLVCVGPAAAAAAAASDSIRASGFGLKIAAALRRFGWPDETVVFALAMLPIVELRGAIPVGYWMQLMPLHLTVLSVIGNMVPVPFIMLYLKKFATFLAGKNKYSTYFLELLLKQAREKAGPVEEFQWLGLMLFVAVPFPGTGAWTGAIIASILDMPFWSAITANFFGVVFAGLLVNLLVNLGLKYAVITALLLFFISTSMWSILQNVKKSFRSN